MDYTSKLRKLMTPGNGMELEAWIDTQHPIDRADLWREVKRLTQFDLRKKGVDIHFALTNALQMDKEIAKLENNMLNLLHQTSEADREQFRLDHTEESGMSMLASTRDYLIMCHKMKTYNTELLKPLALHVLKSERDAGVYDTKKWRSYDDFLEDKDLPASTQKALDYRVKLIDLMLNASNEDFEDWIFTQPLEDQGAIFRQIKEIQEETIEIQGENPEHPLPNMDAFDAWVSTYEQACLTEKVAVDNYIADLKRQAEVFGTSEKDPAQAERETIIASIYYKYPKQDVFKERARQYIAADKAAGIYDPNLWGRIEDQL